MSMGNVFNGLIHNRRHFISYFIVKHFHAMCVSTEQSCHLVHTTKLILKYLTARLNLKYIHITFTLLSTRVELRNR